MVDLDQLRRLSPEKARTLLNDGNYGGLYQRSDDDMNLIWQTALDEVRELLNGNWGDLSK